jgi:hypothetical protein
MEETKTTTDQVTADNKAVDVAPEFDYTAFINGNSNSKQPENTEANPPKTETTDSKVNDDQNKTADDKSDSDDFEFNWDSDSAETKEDKSETKTDTSSNQEQTVDNKSVDDSTKTVNFDFEGFSKGFGIEAKSKEDFEARLKEIVEERDKLRSLTQASTVNEGIRKLEDIKRLADEDLVSKDYKLNYPNLSDEELKDVIDTLKENNTLKIKALEIRKTIDNAIQVKTKEVLDSAQNAEMVAKQEYESQKAQFRKHLDVTEEIFGFKIGKTPEEVKQKREDHFKYVTSKEFAKEIFESDKNLLEASWLWKYRDTLFKALKSQGKHVGRKEVLDKIHNPETSTIRRVLDPSGTTTEFNPQKFMGKSNQ